MGNFPYSDKVMDHFMNPRNMGEIENADGVGTVGNPSCGDVMRLFVKIKDGVIEDARFKTFGCGAAIATSSMTTEMVKGKTIEEALELSNQAVAEALDGLPKVKMHCSVLAEDALREAICDYIEKNPDQATEELKAKCKAAKEECPKEQGEKETSG